MTFPYDNGGFPQVFPVNKLARPSLRITQKGVTFAKVEWDAVPNATSYVVEFAGEQVASGNILEYDFTGLTPKQLKSVQVKAVGTGIESRWATLGINLSGQYTTPVVSLVSKTDVSFSISWTNPNNLSLFELRLNGADAGTSSITTAEFTTLTADTDYLIEVRAGDGQGNWSEWGELVVRTDEAAPATGGVNLWIAINNWSAAA